MGRADPVGRDAPRRAPAPSSGRETSVGAMRTRFGSALVFDQRVEDATDAAGVPGALRLLGDDDPFEQLDPIVGAKYALVDEGQVSLGGEPSRDVAGGRPVAHGFTVAPRPGRLQSR